MLKMNCGWRSSGILSTRQDCAFEENSNIRFISQEELVGELGILKLVFSVFEENPHHCYLCNLGGMRQSKADSVPPRFIFNRLLKSVLRNLPGCNMQPSKSRPIKKDRKSVV